MIPHLKRVEDSTMLVLSRKIGEKICIADNITLTVVSIDGGKVGLGVDAPPEVVILREELLLRQGGNDSTGNTAATK